MAKKYLMTWDARRKRWGKNVKIRGKWRIVNVSPKLLGCPATKEGSWKAANDWWKEQEKELKRQEREENTTYARLERAVETHQKMAQWYHFQGDAENAALHENEARTVQGWIDSGQVRELEWGEEPMGGISEIGQHVWSDRFKTLERMQSGGKTIGQVVDLFIAHRETQHKAGRVGDNWLYKQKLILKKFREWIGDTQPVTSITGQTITSWYSRILEMRQDDTIKSNDGAGKHFGVVKKFIRWSYENEHLPNLPRNIDSEDMGFEVDTYEIEITDVPTIQTLFQNAVDRTKLFYLLALNCGATQADIANLKHEEVDWDKGIIERKRTKTRNNGKGKVPKVKYFLWPETFRLLKLHRSGDGDLVFLGEKGNPLRSESAEGETIAKADSIRNAHSRVLKKLGWKKPTFKVFRATAASMFDNHTEFSRYAQYFLGHSPKAIVDKHYKLPSDEQFKRALLWLRKQLTIDEIKFA